MKENVGYSGLCSNCHGFATNIAKISSLKSQLNILPSDQNQKQSIVLQQDFFQTDGFSSSFLWGSGTENQIHHQQH